MTKMNWNRPKKVRGQKMTPYRPNRFVRCKAKKADGTRCAGGAQHGYEYCGPHLTKIISGTMAKS